MIEEIREFSKTQQCKNLVYEYDIKKISIRALAEKYNLSRTFIQDALRYQKITIRRSFLIKKNKELFETDITKKIIEDYKLPGNNIRSLARKFNVSRKFVSIVLKRFNIELKTEKEVKKEYKDLGLSTGKNHQNYGKPSPIGSGRCRWYYYDGKKYQGSWEFMFGLWLKQQDIKFNVHENVKQFECKYEDGKSFTYCPDFYLIDYDRYVEIKGYFSEENKKRMSIFKIQYPNIDVTVIGEDKLVEIGAFDIHKSLNIDMDMYQLDYKNSKSVKKFIEEVNKIEFIKSYIIEGLNLSKLAEKYDTTYRIINHVYRLWVPEYNSKEYYDFILQNCKDDIIKDYEAGLKIIRKYKFRSNPKILFDAIISWGIKKPTIFESNKILQDYNLGFSKCQLCKKYNLGRNNITSILVEANISTRPVSHYTLLRHKTNRQQMLEGKEQQILDDYKSGLGIRTISKKYNVLRCVIKELLLKNNIEIRKSSEYNVSKFRKINDDIDIDSIIIDYNKGKSIIEIAIKHNIARHTIKQLLIKNDIEIRTAKDYAVIVNKQRKLVKQQDVISQSSLILNDYDNGMRIKLLSRKYNVSRDVIKNIIISNGLNLKSIFSIKKQIKINKKLDDIINKDQIVQDYISGLSINNICTKYHHKRWLIKKLLITNGIENFRRAEDYASIVNKQKNLENRQKLVGNKLESLISDYNLGISIRQLQQKYNISYHIIKMTLFDNSIDIKKRVT